MHPRRVIATGLLALLVASGCQTIETFDNPDHRGSPIYRGARQNLQYLGTGALNFSFLMIFLGLIDLPFSFVADTLLLPVTIPRANERGAVLAETERVDQERPSPVTARSGEAPEAIAERLFERCRKLTEALDPAVTDCYSIAARVVLQRADEPPQSLSGAQYKQEIRARIPEVRYRGDFITYRDVRYEREGEAVRVQVQRATAFSPRRVAASFKIARCSDGQWRIVEESSPGW